LNLVKPVYTYRATLNRVIDGDTIDVTLDLGFQFSAVKRLRLLDIDTNELRSQIKEERELAQKSKTRVQELLESADEIYVQTVMDSTGKYGRLLAYVWYEKDGVSACLNTQLVEEGHQKVKS
jgi:micrococcal nuclease